MNRDEQQQLIVAIKAASDAKVTVLTARNLALQAWLDGINDCCADTNLSITEKNTVLTEWAADFAAIYSDFLCQLQDDAVINWQIVFDNYLCMQEDVVTTTTTTGIPITTTTTTVDPDQVNWQIEFDNYKCQMEDDPTVTTTTTFDETVAWEATYKDFLCGLEDNPLITTTTTTFSGTTTTSTTVDPEDVAFLATYSDFLCQMEDNPLVTTTTTTHDIDEDDVDWQIVFDNYLCMQTDVTTTTTTLGPTTTTTTGPVTTTTTTIPTTTTTTTNVPCGIEKTGGYTYYSTYAINVGSGTGVVQLNIDTVSAPDKFTVEFDGVEVINTGYRGNVDFQNILYAALLAEGATAEAIVGSSTGTFTFNKTTSTEVAVVRVYAPIDETEWSFTLGCVGATTTTTTRGTEFSATYDDYLCALEDDGITTTTTTTETPVPITTTTTTYMVPEFEVSCGAGVNSGTQTFPSVYVVVGMGSGVGWINLTYDTKDIPDKFIVKMDGIEIMNTGYRGSTDLQNDLDAALAVYGEPSETIVSGGSGVATFYKTSSSTLAIVEIWSPIPETEWSWSLSCPDGATTTTTTAAVTTTTTTPVTTTTTTGPTTTTTTNAIPVSTDNSVENARATCGATVALVPADFTFTDADGDDLDYVKIVSYSLTGAGTLEYNGTAVKTNEKFRVYGGAVGSFLYSLIYTPDSSETGAYSDTISFLVRTDNNGTYG